MEKQDKERSTSNPEVATEGQQTLQRFRALLSILIDTCEDSALFVEKPWEQEDVKRAKLFLLHSVQFAHPKVSLGFFEHCILTGLYARKLAEVLPQANLNPLLAESGGLLHDIGLIVNPLRDEVITDTLFKKTNVREEFLSIIPPKRYMIGLAKDAPDLPRGMTMFQRILYISENLGKKDQDGTLYTIDSMKDVLLRLLRLPQTMVRPWPYDVVMRRGMEYKDLLEMNVRFSISEIQWFRDELGVNLDQLREKVAEEFNNSENQKWLSAVLHTKKHPNFV